MLVVNFNIDFFITELFRNDLGRVLLVLALQNNARLVLIFSAFVPIYLRLVGRTSVTHRNILGTRIFASDLPRLRLLCVCVRTLSHVLFRFSLWLGFLKFFLYFPKSFIQAVFLVSRDIFVDLSARWVG